MCRSTACTGSRQAPHMGATRVLLADHHRSFVEALAILLTSEPRVDVVRVAVRPDEVVAGVRDQLVDVAVLTVDDSDAAFLDLVPRLKALRPDLGLVAVCEEDDPGLLLRAVKH